MSHLIRQHFVAVYLLESPVNALWIVSSLALEQSKEHNVKTKYSQIPHKKSVRGLWVQIIISQVCVKVSNILLIRRQNTAHSCEETDVKCNSSFIHLLGWRKRCAHQDVVCSESQLGSFLRWWRTGLNQGRQLRITAQTWDLSEWSLDT